jgi:ribosomal protein S18 acetylase RimI-like enzyme
MGQKHVLRMRRDLSGMTEATLWPYGVMLATLGPKPDRNLVQAAHGVLAAGFWEAGGGAPIFRQWWQALRKDEAFDPEPVFIAVEGTDVIGSAQCGTSAFVKDLAVHPRARRRGVGRALMLAALNAFAARGARRVDLKVHEEDTAAIARHHAIRMQTVSRERSQSRESALILV